MDSSLREIVIVEIICADIGTLLTQINRHGITFRNIQYADSLTIRMQIHRPDLQAVKLCTAKLGGKIKIIRSGGLYRKLKGLSRRPILVAGAVIVLFLVIWVPTRVFFITVEGNEKIPGRYIIEQANLCGISFGASRREVRSEKMKNSLLAAIPSLQWAGINTNGCTAVISVKERANNEKETEHPQVGSIIAVRNGIIESCTAYRGSQQCKPGQAVKSGDVLISGYTDCGIKITATRAEGEVIAQTRHNLEVFAPTDYRKNGEITCVERKYGIIIGKKRINFYKGSGILGAGCDKIYKEYCLKLPGGFQLPVSIFVTTISRHNQTTVSAAGDIAEASACTYAQQYLLSQMISGKILQSISSTQYQNDVLVVRGEYICSEMIGRVRYEETIDNYGEDHGENR